MNKQLEFHMLVGLPASGKSTRGKELSIELDAVRLSSDELRQEMWGNEEDQQNPQEIFNELYKRAKTSLQSGKSVLIDATNIQDNRRRIAIEEFKRFATKTLNKEIKFVVHYFNTSYDFCVTRNRKRERNIPEHVLAKMYKGLQIPTYAEGWDEINIVTNAVNYDNTLFLREKSQEIWRTEFENLVSNDANFEDLFEELRASNVFCEIYSLAQDNPHHTYNVGRHTYYVWKDLLDNYTGKDRIMMLWVALFHDTGKAFCKEFDEEKKYARFIGHENVSSQLACEILTHLGYDKDFVIKACEIIQNHMKLLSIGDSQKGRDRLYNFLGGDTFEKLERFRESDVSAK